MEHQTSSWRIPINLEKIYLANHLLIWENRCYCYLCDEILLQSDTYAHTNLKTHKKLLQAQQPKKRILKLSCNDISYQLLMSNSAIVQSKNEVACKICNCSAMSLKSFVAHIAELSHVRAKLTFFEKLEHRLNGKMDRGPTSDNSKISSPNVAAMREKCSYIRRMFQHSTEDRDKHSQSNEAIKNDESIIDSEYLPDNYVMEKKNKCYCVFCHATVSSIEDHLSMISHVKAQINFQKNKITFEKDGNYWCGFCNRKISRFHNISPHTNGSKHRKASAKNDISFANEKEDSLKNEEKAEKTLSNKYIVWCESKSRGRCKVCDCGISSLSCMESHVTGKRHIMKLKLFSENEIEFKENNIYYCKICNTEIQQISNVYKHMNEVEHTCAVDKLRNEDNRKSEDATANIQKTIAPIPSSVHYLSNDYVIKEENGYFWCTICHRTLDGEKLTAIEHVIGKGHTAAFRKYGCGNISRVEAGKKNYFCRCCNCGIPDMKGLWRHTLGKEHAKFVKIGKEEFEKGRSDSNALEKRSKPLSKSAKFKTRGNEMSIRSKRAKSRIMKAISQMQMANLKKKATCNTCRLELRNTVELHIHLAKHFVEDVFVSEDVCEKITDEKDSKLNHKKVSSLFNVSTESFNTILLDDYDDGENISLSPEMRSDIGPAVQELVAPTTLTKKITEIANFATDEIYSMKEKSRDFELAIKLSRITSSQKIYCLVCQTTTIYTAENYLEHLYDLNHCVRLERMEKYHEQFLPYPEQFSELRLGLEYMVTLQKDSVYCCVCDKNVDDTDDALSAHIEDSFHGRSRETARKAAKMSNLDRIISSINCDWYKVHRYHCVICCKRYKSEARFVRHLSSKGHSSVNDAEINAGRRLMFDYCEACALLWYGYKRVCAYHRKIETHVWLVRDAYFTVELPESAKDFLADTENYVKNTLNLHNDTSDEKRKKEKLIRDLEISVKSYCRSAKAHVFGSRDSGMPLIDTDLDVFLDCGKMDDGEILPRDVILGHMHGVCKAFNVQQHCWKIIERLTKRTSPILKIEHIPTGLSCGIAFGNGHAFENTHLIRLYSHVFPLCREMIIFLERWKTLCQLTGPEFINDGALYWHVIFYLQQESMLPSVTKFIEMINESHEIAEWKVEMSRDFACELPDRLRLGELLSRFFQFWRDFDYQRDIASPLNGNIVKKCDIRGLTKLPAEQAAFFIDYMEKSFQKDQQLEIDSIARAQEPFDLQHIEITPEIRKIYVNRFRNYCSVSFDILRP